MSCFVVFFFFFFFFFQDSFLKVLREGDVRPYTVLFFNYIGVLFWHVINIK